ncbi:MAG: type II secretion system GspH family protein, partial [Candidatus Omnitrophica bacterium]|nr:type II secretion system GspH family protein [Candidatus Omnitrophota bacterium]
MKTRQQKGFTLIELIIGLVVISIAVGTMVSVFADVVYSSVLPEIINTSAALAEQELERVSGMRFSSIANEGPTNYPGAFSSYSYQITV